MIPRIYYPFIRGPFNETIDELATKTGAKINIPPPSASSEVIVVTGEKEGVHRAAAAVREIYENVKDVAKSVTCQVKFSNQQNLYGKEREFHFPTFILFLFFFFFVILTVYTVIAHISNYFSLINVSTNLLENPVATLNFCFTPEYTSFLCPFS